MFSDVYQPAAYGQATPSHIHAHADQVQVGTDLRHAFQVIPINLSPEEIRTMVRDILG